MAGMCIVVFFEKPKNMIYLWSLVMLTSTFPFVGMLPFVIYYMISRVHWRNDYTKAAQIMLGLLETLGKPAEYACRFCDFIDQRSVF